MNRRFYSLQYFLVHITYATSDTKKYIKLKYAIRPRKENQDLHFKQFVLFTQSPPKLFS